MNRSDHSNKSAPEDSAARESDEDATVMDHLKRIQARLNSFSGEEENPENFSGEKENSGNRKVSKKESVRSKLERAEMRLENMGADHKPDAAEEKKVVETEADSPQSVGELLAKHDKLLQEEQSTTMESNHSEQSEEHPSMFDIARQSSNP